MCIAWRFVVEKHAKERRCAVRAGGGTRAMRWLEDKTSGYRKRDIRSGLVVRDIQWPDDSPRKLVSERT